MTLNAIAGRDDMDATSADVDVPDYTANLTEGVKGLRVGIVTDLRRACCFAYAAFDPQSGLHEREFLHVWVGTFEGKCAPNPDEVAEIHWSHRDEVRMELEDDPSRFTPWFAMG